MWTDRSIYQRGRVGSIAVCTVFESLSPTHLVSDCYWCLEAWILSVSIDIIKATRWNPQECAQWVEFNIDFVKARVEAYVQKNPRSQSLTPSTPVEQPEILPTHAILTKIDNVTPRNLETPSSEPSSEPPLEVHDSEKIHHRLRAMMINMITSKPKGNTNKIITSKSVTAGTPASSTATWVVSWAKFSSYTALSVLNWASNTLTRSKQASRAETQSEHTSARSMSTAVSKRRISTDDEVDLEHPPSKRVKNQNLPLFAGNSLATPSKPLKTIESHPLQQRSNARVMQVEVPTRKHA